TGRSILSPHGDIGPHFSPPHAAVGPHRPAGSRLSCPYEDVGTLSRIRAVSTSRPRRIVVTDQLSSDLASLQIQRDAPQAPSPLRKLVVPILVIGLLGAAGVVGYQRFASEVFKHEVKTTEVAMISPSQADVQVTATGYVIPQITSKVGSKLPG